MDKPDRSATLSQPLLSAMQPSAELADWQRRAATLSQSLSEAMKPEGPVASVADQLAEWHRGEGAVLDEMARHVHLQQNPVVQVCEAVKRYVEEFERTLDNDHEIAVRLASFGGEVTFHAEQIGFSKPNVITFYGKTAAGEKVQLIQHVSQLSFLLKAVKKLAPTPNRIGFIWN